jgi:hypothetical protein
MTLETLHVYILQKERILQLIVSGTLANAGRPERVKKQKQKIPYHFKMVWYVLRSCDL